MSQYGSSDTWVKIGVYNGDYPALVAFRSEILGRLCYGQKRYTEANLVADLF